MEQLSLAYKKIFSFSLIFVVSFTLVFGVTAEATLAQTNPDVVLKGVQVETNAAGVTTVSAPSAVGSQAQTTQTGIQNPNTVQKSAEDITGSITGGVAGCAASVVGNIVSQATGTLFKNTSPENFTNVSVYSNETAQKSGSFLGGPPSLDSIGYCIINAVIEYLTQATIDWINSGFDGNPAFVDNPEKFFTDLANVETAGFLQQVVGQTTGLDICQPFRLNIVTGLAGNSGDSYGRQSSCTLDQIASAAGNSGVKFDYNEYTSGRSRNGGNLDAWWGVTQNDQNNAYGSYFLAQKELQKRLAVKGNTAQLDLTAGRGFLSYKKCTQDGTTKGPDGKDVPFKGTCGIVTPGSVIEQQLNNRLSSGNNRLLLADKFDQVITALVNQLIKVALNQVLDKTQ